MNRIFLIIGLLAFVSCHREGKETEMPSPQQLLLEIYQKQSFASVEQVANWIINKDPSLVLVDVRQPAEFKQFSLPGAINIPLGELLSQENRKQIDCEKFKPVFFSNDDLQSEKAWMLHRRLGCASGYVMKGGLNAWVSAILAPQEPPQTASEEAFELYRFRQALAKYFTGGSKALGPEPFATPVAEQLPAPKKIQTKPKPKAAEEEEGC
ncbi:MAG: rhodanese-like domain-containing protein [Haliscomenobacter sp.]|nr:rhodanese-like domain-containing protein [Haliscomenobacter sp.]MBK8654215.1 rhodanese-like domain-containing protein [Haliscomenobacter sp.]MBP9076446.1 rhodanese-like domain-containing protein [Haliscomenobacter sp.]MBP9873837.1 rhodanese-like domain-containing protein [Haliscomenobacter sp.]